MFGTFFFLNHSLLPVQKSSCKHVFFVGTYTIANIHLTPCTQSNTWLQACLRLSVGVEGGGEDDVPADGQGGLLHLAPQDGVSHDAGGLSHLLQHLVQALDAAHHRALLDVCQLGDLCKRLRGGEM